MNISGVRFGFALTTVKPWLGGWQQDKIQFPPRIMSTVVELGHATGPDLPGEESRYATRSPQIVFAGVDLEDL